MQNFCCSCFWFNFIYWNIKIWCMAVPQTYLLFYDDLHMREFLQALCLLCLLSKLCFFVKIVFLSFLCWFCTLTNNFSWCFKSFFKLFNVFCCCLFFLLLLLQSRKQNQLVVLVSVWTGVQKVSILVSCFVQLYA